MTGMIKLLLMVTLSSSCLPSSRAMSIGLKTKDDIPSISTSTGKTQQRFLIYEMRKPIKLLSSVGKRSVTLDTEKHRIYSRNAHLKRPIDLVHVQRENILQDGEVKQHLPMSNDEQNQRYHNVDYLVRQEYKPKRAMFPSDDYLKLKGLHFVSGDDSGRVNILSKLLREYENAYLSSIKQHTKNQKIIQQLSSKQKRSVNDDTPYRISREPWVNYSDKRKANQEFTDDKGTRSRNKQQKNDDRYLSTYTPASDKDEKQYNVKKRKEKEEERPRVDKIKSYGEIMRKMNTNETNKKETKKRPCESRDNNGRRFVSRDNNLKDGEKKSSSKEDSRKSLRRQYRIRRRSVPVLDNFDRSYNDGNLGLRDINSPADKYEFTDTDDDDEDCDEEDTVSETGEDDLFPEIEFDHRYGFGDDTAQKDTFDVYDDVTPSDRSPNQDDTLRIMDNIPKIETNTDVNYLLSEAGKDYKNGLMLKNKRIDLDGLYHTKDLDLDLLETIDADVNKNLDLQNVKDSETSFDAEDDLNSLLDAYTPSGKRSRSIESAAIEVDSAIIPTFADAEDEKAAEDAAAKIRQKEKTDDLKKKIFTEPDQREEIDAIHKMERGNREMLEDNLQFYEQMENELKQASNSDEDKTARIRNKMYRDLAKDIRIGVDSRVIVD